ncbi:MAG: putative Ig domain-containing protein [Planctomycetota bacterium]|nr:putative Ig domain-containing protein [Planctomycetota bacterium]
MRTPHASRWLRGAWLGVLLACLGFSFALATSDSPAIGGASARGISSICSRPLARIITDGDLGVVVMGTQFTRQIIAVLGFKPHHFAFGSNKPTSDLTLSDSGTLSGVKADLAKEIFDVKVADDINGKLVVSDTKFFTITAVESKQFPPLRLQIVTNKPGPVIALPVAVANEPYSYTVQANGGQPPYVFGFAGEDDFLGMPVGLSLSSTGLIMGKPIVPTGSTPAQFSLTVTDDFGAQVTQKFSLVVLAGTISSEFVATAGNFKLSFGKERSRDSLRLTVILNKTDLGRGNIRTVADLAGVPFAMDFGGVALPPSLSQGGTSGQTTGTSTAASVSFDKNGRIHFPDRLAGVIPAKGVTTAYEIKLNPRTGVLTATFSGIDMIETLGADFKSFGKPRGGVSVAGAVIPVNIRIGTPAASVTATPAAARQTTGSSVAFDRTDVVNFFYVRNGSVGKGNARSNDKKPPGGSFLVTKVQGKEKQVGAKVPGPGSGDQLFLRVTGFMRKVAGEKFKLEDFKTTDEVSILFGKTCLGCIPSSLKQEGDKIQFVNEDVAAAPLFNFVIDNKKGTFFIDTHGIPPGLLFAEDILLAGEPYVMTVTVTIYTPGTDTPTFDGQSSVTLFRKGNTIRNK